MALLDGYIRKVVARVGLLADLPALLQGEIGYAYDVATFFVGDTSISPPRIFTDKSVGVFEFNDVTSFRVCDVRIADGKVDGVHLPDLDISNGFLVRRGSGEFGNVPFGSEDNSILITGGNGLSGNLDIKINFAALPRARPGQAGIMVLPIEQNGWFLRDDGQFVSPNTSLGYTPELLINKGVNSGYAPLDGSANVAGYVKTDGSIALTGDLNASLFRWTGLADPVVNQDLITLNFLQAALNGIDNLRGRFLGVHLNLAALVAAHPSPLGRSWAILSNGTSDATVAIWDTSLTTPAWVELTGTGGTTGFLLLTGGTMTGPIGLSFAAPSVNFNSTAPTVRGIYGETNLFRRWFSGVSSEAETGLNAGSNFHFNRYDDAGALIGTAISINRKTGVVNFSVAPTVGGTNLASSAAGATNSDQVTNLSEVPGITLTDALNALFDYNSDSSVLSPTVFPTATLGASYSLPRADQGGVGPFSYEFVSGVLPAGLVLNAVTGLISGIPTQVGTYPLTMRRNELFGMFKQFSANLVSVATPMVATPPAGPLQSRTRNAALSIPFTTTGGLTPYTYSISAGSLPPGVSLSAGGVMSGTPISVASYAFTVRRTDSLGTILDTAHTLSIITDGPAIGELKLFTNMTVNYQGYLGARGYIITDGEQPTAPSVFGYTTPNPVVATAGNISFTVDGYSGASYNKYGQPTPPEFRTGLFVVSTFVPDPTIQAGTQWVLPINPGGDISRQMEEILLQNDPHPTGGTGVVLSSFYMRRVG